MIISKMNFLIINFLLLLACFEIFSQKVLNCAQKISVPFLSYSLVYMKDI